MAVIFLGPFIHYLLRKGFLLNLQLVCLGSLAVPKDIISTFRVLELDESAGLG